MNNEPKAGAGIDPEMMAAYIEKRLSPEQRAAVEAQLAADPDSYAVLVESMRTIDALEVPAVPEVKVPPIRRWVIAAASLAAAAAIAVAIVQPQWLPRFRGGSVDPTLERLVAAVGDQRNIEARLTGGFPHAPLVSVTRGSAAPGNLALMASAGEIQKQAATAPTPAVLRAWATAQVLTGDLVGATNLLAELSAQHPEDAALHSDLAATLLARVAAGESQHVALALDQARQAAELNQRLPEAAFNHALALEAASLFSQALAEWRRLISLETDDGWRAEAEQHIRAIELRLQVKPRASVLSPAADALALGGLLSVLRTPTDADWAAGLTFVRRFKDGTGDRLTLAIWDHAHRHTASEPLRAGLEALQHGAELLDASQLLKAEESFRAANRLLRQADSPAVAWAEYFETYCLFFQGRTVEAIALLKPMVPRSAERGYLTVALRATHLLGLGWLRLGLHATVLEVQQRAARLAATLGDRTIEVNARSQVADAFERLSMRDASWKERAVVLQRSAEGRDPSARHVSTVGASRAAAAEGLTHAAEAFALEALDNGVRWGHAGAQAEARIRLADVANRERDAEKALSLLRDAEANLDSLPDGVFADGWRADLEILRADAALVVSDAEAFAASQRAFDVLARRPSPFRLARARWVRGRSLARENPQSARQEFVKGLESGAAERAALDPFGRSLAEQRWLLLKEILSLPQRPDAAEADLAVVLSTMFADGRADLVRSQQRALASDEVLLVFVALERELLRWRITSAGIDRKSLRVGRVDLERAVKEQSRQVRQPKSSGWLAASDHLSHLLLDDVTVEAPAKLRLITDELLAEVTFAALRWPGSRRFLDETTDVTTLASGRPRHARRPSRTGLRALVIGDPTTALDASFPPLPGARQESLQIAALYANVALLIGSDATQERVAAELPAAEIVHYAGHAVGDRTDPSTSRMVLAADQHGSGFTAAEVVQLPINARVVVLAACQGALAASAGNVPVRGLASAFLKAGAGAVVAAQWDIDDRHATSFVRRLHHWLVTGAPASRAVRLAQSELRQEPGYSHPFYWAGFGAYSTIDSPNGDVE